MRFAVDINSRDGSFLKCDATTSGEMNENSSSTDVQDTNLSEDLFTHKDKIHVLRLSEDGRTCWWSPVDGKRGEILTF